MPIRIQRQRTRGWRMPPDTVYVGRGSIWGNPFVIGQPSGVFPVGMGRRGQAETLIASMSREQVIEFYKTALDGCLLPEMYPHGHDWIERFRKRRHCSPGEEIKHDLRRRNLCCWCALDQPCHADVLLEIANR
jgi:hypothetical protein